MGKEIESPDNQNQNQLQQKQLGIDNDQTQKIFNNLESKQDEQVLNFMDSLDSFLSLIHSLSSTLRQGWFDLASARYSMGTSRVNGVLLNLKEHSAATYVKVGSHEETHFTLCKWASANAEDSREPKDGDSGLTQKSSIRQRHKDTSEPAGKDEIPPIDEPFVNSVDQVQKERVKSLAVFGTFVSPKLRSSQSSFETALETLIEIANMRASMLSSFDELQKEVINVDGAKN